ncbi:hypothetical protein Avbf_03783, partial [Armadillidium vulgare]
VPNLFLLSVTTTYKKKKDMKLFRVLLTFKQVAESTKKASNLPDSYIKRAMEQGNDKEDKAKCIDMEIESVPTTWANSVIVEQISPVSTVV